MNPTKSNQNAEVINQVPKGLAVNFNPAYLESILLNLIFNSIRYSSPKRRPRVEISTTLHDEQVSLHIRDNGIGIDLDKYGDQLFGLYKTFTDHQDSKGIGLFISKNQVNAMGGKVTVQSKVDEGTTFTILFR